MLQPSSLSPFYSPLINNVGISYACTHSAVESRAGKGDPQSQMALKACGVAAAFLVIGDTVINALIDTVNFSKDVLTGKVIKQVQKEGAYGLISFTHEHFAFTIQCTKTIYYGFLCLQSVRTPVEFKNLLPRRDSAVNLKEGAPKGAGAGIGKPSAPAPAIAEAGKKGGPALLPSPADLLKAAQARFVRAAQATAGSGGRIPSEHLVDYWKGTRKLGGGGAETFSVTEALAQNHTHLEANHSFIQLLFPLPDKSGVWAQAPILTDQVIKDLKALPDFHENFDRAFLMMMDFYGLEYKSTVPEVRKAANFEARLTNWMTLSNHNRLRVDRIILSTALLGRKTESVAFWNWLQKYYNDSVDKGYERISASTYVDYWATSAAYVEYLFPGPAWR